MAGPDKTTETFEFPEPSDSLQQGLSWRSLRYFGAGAIMVSVTIGSGETLFASRGGLSSATD